MKNINIAKLIARDIIYLLLLLVVGMVIMPGLNFGFSVLFIIYCYFIPIVYYVLLYAFTYVCRRKNRFIRPFYSKVLTNIPFYIIVTISILCFFFVLLIPHGSKLEEIKNVFSE